MAMDRSKSEKGQATGIQSVRLRRPSRDAVWSMSSASGSSPPSGVREVNRITHPILHSSYPTEGREYPEAPTDEHFSIVKEEHSVQLEQRSRERSRECVITTAQFLSASLTHHLSLFKLARVCSNSHEGSPNDTFKRKPRGPGHTPNLGSRSILPSADQDNTSFGSSSSSTVLGLAGVGGPARPSPLLPARSPLVGGPPRGGSPAMRRPINEDGPPSTSDEESEDDNFDPTDELVPCRPQRAQPLNAEGTAPLKWSADSGEYDGSFKKRSPERHERRLAAGASALALGARDSTPSSSRPPAFAAKSGSQRSSALAALSDLSGPRGGGMRRPSGEEDEDGKLW